MPYIDQRRRAELNDLISMFNALSIKDEGELNYLITKLLLASKPERYRDFNKLTGVLECAKLELYRRAISIYENKKITDNGDIGEYQNYGNPD